MTIYPLCISLMKYRAVQAIVERYYRFRIKKYCFIMCQNGRWTLVTMER